MARGAYTKIRAGLGSLELTLACLFALMLLVVACTLVQAPLGTWQAVDLYMRSWFVWSRVPGTSVSAPVFPGGILVGLVLVANLLVAQLGRLERSPRKVGIWIVHAGLLLLVGGEFVTGAFQRETRIALEEGASASWVESPRELELAVVDTTDPSHDDVYAIPERLLAQGGAIEIPGTPLSLSVRRHFPNAAFERRTPADHGPAATAGVGTDVSVTELPRVTAEDEQNRVAALVEPMAAGRSYGVWLVTNALASPQSFVHAGRTYALELRPRREPLSYTLTLKEFRHDVYAGTDIPRNFSSVVHLSNPSTGEERDVLIRMNQPLRYAGRAFYQASFGEGDTLSVLQVVENPGWLLPYVSAVLICLGLLVHFGFSLWRATRRQVAPAPARASASVARRRDRLVALAPWAAGALAVAGAMAALRPPAPVRGFDLDAFGGIPVLEGGRVKPIDSVARNALLVIAGRQRLRDEGREVGADEWLLDVLFRPGAADAQPLFAIDDPEVLGLMGLGATASRHFSARTLAPHLAELERQAAAARRVDSGQRTRFQRAVANLCDRVVLYRRLRNTMQPARSRGLAAEIEGAAQPGAAQRHAALAELAAFRAFPPRRGGPDDAFGSAGEALAAAAAGVTDPALRPWARLSGAWAAQDPRAFERAVAELRDVSEAASPAGAGRAAREVLFNRAEPFYAGMVIYLAALLVLFASWLRWAAMLRSAAFALLVAGALVHTAGLATRVVLQGRPPVTNLYSSAVFVGWAAVVLGILLERTSRRGFATAVAATSGFASLLVAHHLGGSGETMEMMRAVLDSNFWLATHVVAITMGYGGTFVAGALAVAHAIRRHAVRDPEPAAGKALASMTYGVLCFALFFSFAGTILGGIWADQSWGRFWGWDPKENGALLIVLWNAAILHARLAGLVRERGLVAMAIFGNVVTSLSWFGVNMLGVGLHSYGFMDEALRPLSGFIASQLVLVVLAVSPRRLRSGASAARAERAGPRSPACSS